MRKGVRTSAKTRTRQALIKFVYGPQASSRAGESLRRRVRDGGEIRRILVVRPDHLGDLLFATPALERVRKAFPGAHITGAVGPWGRAMWEGNRSINALYAISFPGIKAKKERWPLAPYALLNQHASWLYHRRYDLGIILRFDHWWGAALLWAAGVPRRWGYDTPGMGAWLTNSVPYIEGRHEVEQNLALVEPVVQKYVERARLQRMGGVEIARGKGIPALRPPHQASLPTGLADGWLTAQKRVVIHPGTAAANKLWTIDGWAEVASRLGDEGWSVALTGSPDEERLADAIVSRVEETPLLNLVGKTASLGQLISVLGAAHMVLGVDSGPLHIATALGKPTLHLYGPSDERIWGPWGNSYKHRVLRAPGTMPTMHLEVGSPALEGGPDMRAITVEMVMHEVKALV
ncbi:MAG: glycosyltransferase family 9 protein [Chloroflexia bacterium]